MGEENTSTSETEQKTQEEENIRKEPPNLIWESDFGEDSEIIKTFLTITPELNQYSEFKISYDNTQPNQEGAFPFIIEAKGEDDSFVPLSTYMIMKQSDMQILCDLKSMPTRIPSKVLADFIFDELSDYDSRGSFYHYTFEGALSKVGDQQKIMGRRLPRSHGEYAFEYNSFLTLKENDLIVYSDFGQASLQRTSAMDVMNESIDRCARYVGKYNPDVKYMRLIHTDGDFHNNNRHPLFIQIWKDGQLIKISVYKPRDMSPDAASSTCLKLLGLPFVEVHTFEDDSGKYGTCEFIEKFDTLPSDANITNLELATLLGQIAAALCFQHMQDLHMENFVLGRNKLGDIAFFVLDGEAFSFLPFRSVNEANKWRGELSSYINLSQTFPTKGDSPYIDTLLYNLNSDNASEIDLKQCFLTGFFDCAKRARDTIPKSQYEKLQSGITGQRIVPISTSDLTLKLHISDNDRIKNNPVNHVFLLAIKIINYLKMSTRDPALLSTPPLLSKLYVNKENQVSLSIPTYCVKNDAMEVTWQQDTSGKYNDFCNFIQALVQTRSNHDVPKFNLNGNRIVMDSFIININQPEGWTIPTHTGMYIKSLNDLDLLEKNFKTTPRMISKTYEMLYQTVDCLSASNSLLEIARTLHRLIAANTETSFSLSNQALLEAQNDSSSKKFSLKDEDMLAPLFGDNTAKIKISVSEMMTQTSSNKVHPALPTAASAVKVQRTTPSATQGLQKNPSAAKH